MLVDEKPDDLMELLPEDNVLQRLKAIVQQFLPANGFPEADDPAMQLM